MADQNVWSIYPNLLVPPGATTGQAEINGLLNGYAGIFAGESAVLAGLSAWAFVIPGGVAIGLSLTGAAVICGVLSGTFWASTGATEWVVVEPSSGPTIQPASTEVSELRLTGRDAHGITGDLEGVPVRVRRFQFSRENLLDRRAYNVEQYVRYYQDLNNPAGKDEHWVNFGIREGRRANDVLDPPYYLQLYQDLQDAFGATNYVQATQHWIENGLREGRQGSMEFDARWYLENNVDLVDSFGWDYEKALDHWWQNGLDEGRRASAEFDIGYYMASNADLQASFGAGNFREALRHWIEYGKSEGRQPVG